MGNFLVEMVHQHKAGRPIGVYSACTASKYAIMAVLQRAKAVGQPALIEATANQVDQNGGYTGMTPQVFARYVYHMADMLDFPREQVILGGDHLGPLTQCGYPEAKAMSYAADLVTHYIAAGFTKIHLDTSMHLADDAHGKPLDNAVIARRGAQLCHVAENAYRHLKAQNPSAQAPVYVIGSEVPVPGGAREAIEGVQVTRPEDCAHTISTFRQEFINSGLESAWQRVIGLVVQPGVEFDDSKVFVYDREKAAGLTRTIREWPQGVFEGHSTDYQPREALRAMVEDGIAILKVGPALTFALREALFSLEDMEKETYRGKNIPLSNFRDVLEQCMINRPQYWENHYHGDSDKLRIARQFSYLDRSRYYMNDPLIHESIRILIGNIDNTSIPLTLLSQYMPMQYEGVRAERLPLKAEALIMDHIGICIDHYQSGCNQK